MEIKIIEEETWKHWMTCMFDQNFLHLQKDDMFTAENQRFIVKRKYYDSDEKIWSIIVEKKYF